MGTAGPDDPDDEFEVDEEEIGPSWWHQGFERPKQGARPDDEESQIEIAIAWPDRASLPQAIARELAALGISATDFNPTYVVLLDVDGVALTSQGDPVPLGLNLEETRFPLRVTYSRTLAEGESWRSTASEASVPRPPPSDSVLVSSGGRTLRSRLMMPARRPVVSRPGPPRGALRGASGRPVRICSRPAATEEELREEEDELVGAVLAMRGEVERTCQRSAALVGTRYAQMALDLQMDPVEYTYLQKVTQLQTNMELLDAELGKLRGLDSARAPEDVTDAEEPEEVGCESSSKTPAIKNGAAGSGEPAECSETSSRGSRKQVKNKGLPLNAYGIDQGEEVFNEIISPSVKWVPPR